MHGKIIKEPLTDSPFVRWLDYGVNYEGYWNYHHMIVQFEDIIDCIQVLYQHQYDFIFYFDHSSGHDHRLQPDGLNANAMNKRYDGNQLKMRSSIIKDNTYLGPYSHSHKLHIGEAQDMNYNPNTSGPFYLSTEEQER